MYKREPRFAGQTDFTPAKMVRFALDAITSFSYLPLQIAGYLGLLVTGVGLVGVLGEYLGRIAEESKDRPLYLVRERWDSEGLRKGD